MSAFHRIKIVSWCALMGAALVPGLALADDTPTALRVYPSEVSLTTARDAQSIVVQAEYANGITRDVTDKVRWRLDGEQFVSQERNRLVPRGDGQAKLTATFESLSAEVPITVAQAATDPQISFKLDVMP